MKQFLVSMIGILSGAGLGAIIILTWYFTSVYQYDDTGYGVFAVFVYGCILIPITSLIGFLISTSINRKLSNSDIDKEN
jgi:ABC-type Fe3+-siderophore transport system permease subunit